MPVMRRSSILALLIVTLATLAAACSSEGARMRTRIAGEYVFEIGDDYHRFRQVLTLREDSRWTRVTTSSVRGGPPVGEGPSDSGMYRISGAMIGLHSEVHRGGSPLRYVFSGDTLFQSNAAEVHALTGYDIGEQILVRLR